MIDGSDFSQEGDRTQLFDRVIEKFLVQRHKHTFISLVSDSHTTNIAHFSVDEKDAQLRVIEKLHIMFERQFAYAQLHSDVSGQSDSIARKARRTSREPNLIQNENEWWRFDENSRCSVWSNPIFSKSWRSCFLKNGAVRPGGSSQRSPMAHGRWRISSIATRTSLQCSTLDAW